MCKRVLLVNGFKTVKFLASFETILGMVVSEHSQVERK